jgi:FkbM family methyltransferase
VTDRPTSLDRYLRRPLPIERELSVLFDAAAELVVFDVGACEGEDSIRYQRRFPNARVYAFEPLAGNVERARAHFAASGTSRITLEQVAVSDSIGTATFHISSGRPDDAPDPEWDYGNKSSSLLAPGETVQVHRWLAFEETATVATTTLADYCAANAIERIDFMHLDVQGAELMVLAGAGPVLERIRAVWMEVETVPLYRDQPLAGEVDRFMAEHGFVCVADTVNAVSGDRLYVRLGAFGARKRLSLRALPVARRARAVLRRLRI